MIYSTNVKSYILNTPGRWIPCTDVYSHMRVARAMFLCLFASVGAINHVQTGAFDARHNHAKRYVELANHYWVL